MPDEDTGPDASSLDRLIDAMLGIVVDQGWREVTIENVAACAEVPEADSYAVCADRAQLLNAFARRVDVAASREARAGADDEARYHELLDIMMRRFEVLQANREAVVRLIRELPGDPISLARILPQSQRSFAFLARAAGYDPRPPSFLMLAKALSAVWLATQRDWLRDETPDLSITMASLDRNLRRAMGMIGPLVPPRGGALDEQDERE